MLPTLLFVALSVTSDPKKTDDLSDIQGRWTLVYFKWSPGSELDLEDFEIVISGTKYESRSFGEACQRGVLFKKQSRAGAHELDLRVTFGPNKGEDFRCIYESKRDRLWLCGPMESIGPRPTGFDVPKDSRQMLFVLRKKK